VIREQTKNTSVNWNQVPSNNSVHNKKIKVQQPKPMPVIVNLYAMLDNLQNDVELTHLQSQKNKIDSEKVRTKLLHIQKKKFVIIGDSHSRGCATELAKYLGEKKQASSIYDSTYA
jgi:hypothetical protein